MFIIKMNYSYCEKPDNETDMGGVPHVEGGLNSDLYAVPVKRRQPKDHKDQKDLPLQPSSEKISGTGDINTVDSEDKDENLPPGWEKHEGILHSRAKSLFEFSLMMLRTNQMIAKTLTNCSLQTMTVPITGT